MRAQKVAQLGGGQIRIFGVSVAQLKWPSAKKGGGGTELLYFFQIVECTENLFLL